MRSIKSITLCLIVTLNLLHPPLFSHENRNILTSKININSLKQSLDLSENWVKYPKYRDRDGWNSLFGDLRQSVIDSGEEYLAYSWKIIKATHYLEYKRDSSAPQMCPEYDQNNRALQILILAELAEGKGRFLDQIVDGSFYLCEMTSWTISAHLHSLQRRGTPLPDHKESIVALASSDVGAILSWTHFLFKEEFDKIDPLIAERIKFEVKRRIITPYLNRTDLWWMATDADENTVINNWNSWCNFNVIQSTLLLEDEIDIAAAVVYKTVESIDKFLNYIKGDGACEEGPSYWGHAAGKLYQYLSTLERATSGKYRLFTEPLIKEVGEYIAHSYIGNGWVVNFADASPRGGGNAGLIYRYGRDIGSEEMVGYAAFLANRSKKPNYLRVGRDIESLISNYSIVDELSKLEPKQSSLPYKWYSETEFCYIRNRELFFAAKGGYNAESHNHNDVGSFMVYIDNMPILIDVGVGEYTKKTFSSERYSIWTMQSNFHNLPTINGYSQQFGKEFRSKECSFNSDKMEFKVDISEAYPKEASIKSWVREFKIGENRVSVKESFKLSDILAPTVINLIAAGAVESVESGKISINNGGSRASLLFDSDMVSANIEEINITDSKIERSWGDKIFRITLTVEELTRQGVVEYQVERY